MKWMFVNKKKTSSQQTKYCWRAVGQRNSRSRPLLSLSWIAPRAVEISSRRATKEAALLHHLPPCGRSLSYCTWDGGIGPLWRLCLIDWNCSWGCRNWSCFPNHQRGVMFLATVKIKIYVTASKSIFGKNKDILILWTNNI